MDIAHLIQTVALYALPVLFAITVHEAAHGYAARHFGDKTAFVLGRITLNPLKHIDPMGTILMPLLLYFATSGAFLFGYAKPVPVRFGNLRNPKRDMIWVALAGPLVNVALAGVLAFFYKIANNEYLLYGVYLNLGLACFNMIPLPPLDGSRVLGGLLPRQWALEYFRLERYGFLLIALCCYMRLLIPWVMTGVNFFCKFLKVPTLS